MTNNVAIDNDFLSHLIEIKAVPDLYSLIIRFFNALGVTPGMHPLVYNHEALINQSDLLLKLFKDVVVSILDFDTIRNDPVKRKYYEMQIKQVYHDFTGIDYPVNVFEEWKPRMSFGEVHSVVLCAFIECDCFLSDDKKAAKKLGGIIKNRMSKPIEVKNRQACCQYIRAKEKNAHNLKASELKIIEHKRAL